MNKTLSLPRILSLNAYWIGLSFMWNALHPIVLPALLLNFVPDAQKNTYLGLLTFAGLLIAMVLQPLSGAATDQWSSPFGKRRPLMVIGTLLDFVFLALLGLGGGLLWLILGYVGLQISSNLAQGPLQGLLRDQVPEQQMGLAASVKILMDVLSLIAAALAAGRFIAAGSVDPMGIMLVIMFLLATSAAVTIAWTTEGTSVTKSRLQWDDLKSQFRIDLSRHAEYWWLIGQRGLFLLGIYGVQAFTEYYLQDVWGVPNPVQETARLLAIIAAGVLILVLLGGWLSDRFGAKRIIHVAAATASVGIVMLLATSERWLPLTGAVLGTGIGLFLTSNWALANRLAPLGEAGKYLGLTNLATAGAGALVRLQGPAIDLLNAARPAEWLGYRGLFVFCAACVLLSLVPLARIHAKV